MKHLYFLGHRRQDPTRLVRPLPPLLRLLPLLSLLLISLSFTAVAQTITIDGIIYEISGSEASVTGYDWNSEINEVNIPETITYDDGTDYTVSSIGSGAFYGCSGLTSVTIPASVISIAVQAFSSCSDLMKISVSESNPNFCSVEDVLFDKTKTTLICFPGGKQGEYTIPASVTSIGVCAFCGCSGLTSVTIPASVTSIGDYAFYICYDLMEIIVAESNPNYCSVNGVLFDKTKTTLICFPGGKQGEYIIPASVIYIGNEAFYICTGLTSVTIPASVISIGNQAFSYCSGLKSVTIPASVTSIGDSAFSSCYSLTSVTIGNSVTSIGNVAFCGCSGLTSVTIPTSVTFIGYWAFFGCSGLTSVTIPASVTSIGDDAFFGCSGLTSVKLQDANKWSRVDFGNKLANPIYIAKAFTVGNYYCPLNKFERLRN